MNVAAKIESIRHAGGEGRAGRNGWLGFLPLIVLPLPILLCKSSFEPWLLMWTLAFTIFAGCKWLTWWQIDKTNAPLLQHWAYLLAWPGLNAKEFLATPGKVSQPDPLVWMAALAKTLLGAILLWGVAARLQELPPILSGWRGLLGMIFLLHFGTFHLLALFWQHLGINARPLMRAPILATSLGEFWGHRWNSAFTDLAAGNLLKRLYRRIGVTGAMMVVFLVSGLIHELVISLPAGAGYGLPTLYFLLQGIGLSFQRSSFGRKHKLDCGILGWCFTMAFVAGPAFWLFHPPFVSRVIIPFMHIIHAL